MKLEKRLGLIQTTVCVYTHLCVYVCIYVYLYSYSQNKKREQFLSFLTIICQETIILRKLTH